MNLNSAKWKKPDFKKSILYDSIYDILEPQTNPEWQKVDQWLPREESEAGRSRIKSETKVSFSRGCS
jgi:hypothetical protein